MLKKTKLATCSPGQKVRINPDTVTLEVHLHLRGLTRLKLNNEGFWRSSAEEVYLETPVTAPEKK